MEVNIEKLINSIKIRPALYNKEDSMYYSHRRYKHKLWREVCQEVYKNWNQLTPQEKLEYARELQKRWKNLRTCFTRELAFQRKEKIKRETTNEPIKRRKKYEYFNSLTFLLKPENLEDYTIKRESESDDDPLEIIASNPVPEVSTYNGTDEIAGTTKIRMETIQQYEEPMTYSNSRSRASMEEKLLDMFKDYRDAENDEDKQFVLSLVSYFKGFSSKKKLEARIEVLKLLHCLMKIMKI